MGLRRYFMVCLVLAASCVGESGDEGSVDHSSEEESGELADTESTGDGDGDGDGDGSGDGDESGDAHVNDGDYLLGLSTPLGPQTPFVAIMSIAAQATEDPQVYAGVAGLQFLDAEGLPSGELYIDDSVEIVDGAFTLDYSTVTIEGSANPATGADIELSDLVLTGQFIDADAACGPAAGMVSSPLESDLAGSSFAAQRIEDRAPMSLPEPIYSCDGL